MAASAYDLLWKGTIVAVFVLFFSIIFHDLLTWLVFEQCDLNKFPVIYGVDGCNLFVHRSVNLKFDFSSILLSFIGSKVTFYAFMNSNDSLVFKKLASKRELALFDQEYDYTTSSSVNFTHEKLIQSTYIPFDYNSTFKIRICPNKNSIARFINVYNKSVSHVSREQLLPSLWALLKLNPEPLILTLLKPPEWPVPKYYGSCGRLSVFEYCGTRVTDLIDLPYQKRLNISHQIISAALQFTFDHPDFAFYLTDISPDNIVVNTNGIVKFIDFEHLILVEKIKKGMSSEWMRNHSSRHYDCTDCFSFSPDSICSHQFSDHNIYAVCKELFMPSTLFPGGFLHSPPKDLPTSSIITNLIEKCISPTDNKSRFDIAKELQKLIKSIL